MFPNEPLSVLQAALNSVKQDYVRVVELLEVRYVFGAKNEIYRMILKKKSKKQILFGIHRDRQRTKQVLKNQQHIQTRQRRSSSVGDLPTE